MITVVLPEWLAWVIVAYCALYIADMAMGIWLKTLNRQLMKESLKKVDWLYKWAQQNSNQRGSD